VCSRVAILAVYTLLLSPTAAQAQEKNSFALGVNFTQRIASDDKTQASGGIGVSWRLGHSEEGWGFTYGLGWYGSDIERSIGGRNMYFGELKVRPIVAGYGYTHRFTRRMYLTGDLVGGMAVATFELDSHAAEAMGSAAGSKTRVIPIIRPELKAWYDLNRRWGISVGAWYAIARPSVTLTTPVSTETVHLRADTFSFSTGIVYRIF